VLARNDGAYDAQSGNSGRVGEDLVQLDIHQFQRLLHAQRVLRSRSDEGGAMAPISTHLLHLRRRQETTLQQTESVQLTKPTTVPYVGLATRNVLGVTCVHQAH